MGAADRLFLVLDWLSSDSSLSDVPSDLSCLSLDDMPFPKLTVEDAVQQKVSIYSPTTPTKETITKHQNSETNPKKAQKKLAKVSPYFPKPAGTDSCLPFPPISAPSFGLIQEQLANEPFRLLLATIFLNRTRGGQAIPVLFRIFERYPTIESMAAAKLIDVVEMIHCLGFQNQRAKKCIQLAKTWLLTPPTKGKRYRKLNYPNRGDGRSVAAEECVDDEETDLRIAWEIAHLPGVGFYAIDSWRIFCRDRLREQASDWKGASAQNPKEFIPEWKRVLPTDKELRAYLTWMWLKEGWIWDSETGKKNRASERMMRAAQAGGVAREGKDGNWKLNLPPVTHSVGFLDIVHDL